MNFYKAYALCINRGKIRVSQDKTLDKFTCDIFKSLEEATNELNKKNPIDFQIIEIYGSQNFNSKKFKLELTTSDNDS
jgi:hypothetical protein